jgi:hypothetical protein
MQLGPVGVEQAVAQGADEIAKRGCQAALRLRPSEG